MKRAGEPRPLALDRLDRLGHELLAAPGELLGVRAAPAQGESKQASRRTRPSEVQVLTKGHALPRVCGARGMAAGECSLEGERRHSQQRPDRGGARPLAERRRERNHEKRLASVGERPAGGVRQARQEHQVEPWLHVSDGLRAAAIG